MNKYRVIEVIWCLLGGLLMAVSTKMFSSRIMDLEYDVFQPFFYVGGQTGVFEEFLFGVVITAILIVTIKMYRR